jgi:predicted dehydrogenase
VKFVIAGLGSIGRRHLRNLVASGQRDEHLLRSGRSTLPNDELDGFPTVKDLHSALDWRPDAVIVSNPTALHLDVAIPAAEAGCQLLIEKPLSDSMARVEVLQRAVEASGCRVLVGFQFRFHPTLKKVKSLIEGGSLGRVASIQAHWGEYLPEWHPWEDYRESYAARRDLGGGALLTLCHPFDYLRWIFGEVAEAGGVAERGLGLEVEAVVDAALRFRSGVQASIHLDYLETPPAHYLEVVGGDGRLRWDGRSGALDLSGSREAETQHLTVPDGFGRNDMFLAEMKHFMDVRRERHRMHPGRRHPRQRIWASSAIHAPGRPDRWVRNDASRPVGASIIPIGVRIRCA